MFITTRRYTAEVSALQTLLQESEQRACALEARAERAEEAAHRFAEEARYALESAAIAADLNSPAYRALKAIAHALPYVYSGRRHWAEPPQPEITADALQAARSVTRAYGFELPADPVEAVVSIMELSSMLLVPAHDMPVEGLKIRYPLQQTSPQGQQPHQGRPHE